MGIGVQSMTRRLPMMAGPLTGGWLITRYGWDNGVRFALLGCIVLSAATAIFQWFVAEPAREAVRDSTSNNSRISIFGVVNSFSRRCVNCW